MGDGGRSVAGETLCPRSHVARRDDARGWPRHIRVAICGRHDCNLYLLAGRPAQVTLKKKKKVESGAGSSRCRLSIALCDVRRNRDRTGAELELESQLLSCRLAKCWGGYECDSLWLDGNDIGRRVDTDSCQLKVA